jgi:NAD(P)-dependent dehydrogenase (short-subunit alcohol dehydrogenase family)
LKNAANQKQSDVRIITVSSSGQYQFFPPDYKFEFSEPAFLVGKIPYEPEEYRNKMKEMLDIDGLRYAMSKVAMTLFSQELQSHLDKAGLQITSISLNPGGVRTEAAVAIWDPSMRETMRQQMAGEDEGSYTSLFAATSPEVYLKPRSYKGKYLEPVGEIKDPHAVSKDQSQSQNLWDTTEQEVGKFLLKSGFPALNKWL